MNTEPIRVVIVEDSALCRRALRKLIDAQDDMLVIGEATDGVQAIDRSVTLEPDVVVLDMRLPRASGLDVLERIMASRPVPVLAFTAEPERYRAGAPEDAIRRGALGIVEKPRHWPPRDEDRDSILSQIRLVAPLRVVRHVRPPGRAAPLRVEPPRLAAAPPRPPTDRGPGAARRVS